MHDHQEDYHCEYRSHKEELNRRYIWVSIEDDLSEKGLKANLDHVQELHQVAHPGFIRRGVKGLLDGEGKGLWGRGAVTVLAEQRLFEIGLHI